MVPLGPRANEAYTQMALQLRDTIVAETYQRVQRIPMLAHYTSLDAMENIILSREFWFSSVPDMASVDTSEVVEGTEIVANALRIFGPQIIRTIPFAQLNVEYVLDVIRPKLISQTFAISLCEHGSDQRTDRLTMWRAYGHNGHGLCMVMRKETMLGQTAAGRFPVHWSPIEYDTNAQLQDRVRNRLIQLETAFQTIPAEHRDSIRPVLGEFIVSCILSLIIGHKNAAYVDEQEIRFIRTSLISIAPVPADAVYKEVGTFQKPRRIFSLPLRNYPEFGINADISALLDHIIIGPSDHQEKIYEGARSALDANGLGHVPIQRSEIPFRATV